MATGTRTALAAAEPDQVRMGQSASPTYTTEAEVRTRSTPQATELSEEAQLREHPDHRWADDRPSSAAVAAVAGAPPTFQRMVAPVCTALAVAAAVVVSQQGTSRREGHLAAQQGYTSQVVGLAEALGQRMVERVAQELMATFRSAVAEAVAEADKKPAREETAAQAEHLAEAVAEAVAGQQ